MPSATTNAAADLTASVAWLSVLTPTSRAWVIERMRALVLPGGATLFNAGDASDALYLLVSGCLGAFAANDTALSIGQIVAGDTVGETGLITGKARSASIRALRDSELLRLDRTVFEQLAQRDPHALVAMARLALERVSVPAHARRAATGPRTIALLPQTLGLDVRGFAETLGRALARFGTYIVVDAAAGTDRDPGWFSRLESANQFVIYVADEADSAWRRMTVRQADALLFLAGATTQPVPWSDVMRGMQAPLPRPEHLVLVHTGKPRPGVGRRWTCQRPQARLHHMRNLDDVPRIARLIAGRSLCLVLSGGGARGFAHLGVIKALREAGLAIDSVGGTSIGAIIGAGVAVDWPTQELMEVYRRAFVTTNPLSDYTLPLVSMVSGRKVSRLLREAFGDREIEDLVLPFYCVSSNLTTGRVAVHRQGPLWQWLRASVAIPGVLPPVFQGGQVYVDGSVIDNLPVEIMRERQRGKIIASDIGGDYALTSQVDEFDSPPWWRLLPELFGIKRRPGILSVLLRAGMVNSDAAATAARNATTLLIQPPLTGIDLLDWQAFDRAIEIGYRHTLRVLGASIDRLSERTPLS